MTTRPTDEEIRAMRQWAYRNRGDIGDKVYQFAEAWLAERQTARNGVIINEREAFDVLVDAACEAINKIHKVGKKRFKADMTAVVKAVIEAQARAALSQQQEVTDEMAMLLPKSVELDKKDVHKACETFIRESDYTVVCPEEWMAEAIKSIAPPIKSISDALNFLEEWALSGNTLHGDDIQRFHAAAERIAPIEQTVKVPDEKEDLDPVKLYHQGRSATDWERGFNEGWNECREAMLSAAPAYNGKKEG